MKRTITLNTLLDFARSEHHPRVRKVILNRITSTSVEYISIYEIQKMHSPTTKYTMKIWSFLDISVLTGYLLYVYRKSWI